MEQYSHGGNVWLGGDPDKWIDFSANLNPKGPPKFMIEEIKNNLGRIVYYPQADMESPTANIAEYLNVPSARVLPTSGGISALSLIVEEYRPRKAVILQPGFVEYGRLARNVDAEIVNLPIIQGPGQVTYPTDDIIDALEEYAMVFICNPANPVGSTIPQDSLLKVVQRAEEIRAKVVVDEAFIEFARGETVKGLVSEYTCLVIAGSLTKIFSIPGIRLGYICSNELNIEGLKMRQVPWSLSSFACDATNVLSKTASFIEDSVQENAIQRQWLSTELKKLGVIVFPSKANFLLLNFEKLNVKVHDLQRRLRDYNILIRNCSNYVFLDDYYARIAVKSAADNSKLIRALEQIL